MSRPRRNSPPPAQGAAQPPQGHARLSDLLDEIVAMHHGYLCRELPRLAALLHPETRELELSELWTLFEGYMQLSRRHMTGVEQLMLPLVRELRCAHDRPGCYPGGLRACAADVETYHGRSQALLDQMAAQARTGAPASRAVLRAIVRLQRDHEQHATRELHDLLPAAQQLVLAPHTAFRPPPRPGRAPLATVVE
jgi:hypothetical protein